MNNNSPIEKITARIDDFKKTFPESRNLEDYKVLSLIGLKYFVCDGNEKFDIDLALESLVDGSCDGGIDVLTNDPLSDSNNLVIIQSKLTIKTKLTKEGIVNDIRKIRKSLERLSKFEAESFNQKLLKAYHQAIESTNRKEAVRIIYLTSYSPLPQTAESIRDAIRTEFSGLDIEVYFGKDIQSQIECAENVKTCVETGKIQIDKANNILRYGDNAIIANVSARSIHHLHHLHHNGLLGLNLRYHVVNANVDNKIRDTIKNSPESFWYKNNGITIICDNFKIDGNEIKLENFSIINGGQTTNIIARNNVDSDMYLLCKIIKVLGNNETERADFATSIAQATNNQKPIKASDLKTNAPEQLILRQKLESCGVYYSLKRGTQLSTIQKRKYAQSYQYTTMDTLAKNSVAAILQKPGFARSQKKDLYEDKYYDVIFNNPSYGVMADVLRMNYYFDEFKKVIKKDKATDSELRSIINNGEYWLIASISLLCMLHRGIIDQNVFAENLGDELELSKLFRKVKLGEKKLLNNTLSSIEEKDYFMELFYTIANDVILDCYFMESDNQKSENKALTAANFYKLDTVYYNRVMRKLWSKYRTGGIQKISSLQSLIGKICK